MTDPDPEDAPEPAPETSPRFARARGAIALVVILSLVLAALGSGAWLRGRDDRPSSASPAVSLPTTPTPPGLIAVVDDSGALFTMDADGGSRVSYPLPGVRFGFPAWSPDGSRIAVTGQGTDDAAIYVFSAVTADQPVIVYRSADRPPFYLYWTPDSRAISFLATEPSSISLRIAPADGSAPLDGSGPSSILREGAPLYFDWIDAGTALLHVGLGSDAFTGEVGLDGVLIDQPLTGSGLFRSASVSREGRYLAYVRAETGLTGQLIVAARDGSLTHEVPVKGPAAFVFDPTGDRLAMIAADSSVEQTGQLPIGPLRIIDAATGIERMLLDGPNFAFFWSPDGRTIATIRPAPPGGDVAAGAGVALVAAVEPRTPDATRIRAPGAAARLSFVDVSSGEIRSERFVLLTEDFVNALLPYFDQYALSHNLWSSDSASLLLPLVSATGRNQLVVVPADGSDLRPIAEGSKGIWSP